MVAWVAWLLVARLEVAWLRVARRLRMLVVNGDECRLRRDDEATESGKEMEHTKFIVAVNIGVRGCARRLPRRALT